MQSPLGRHKVLKLSNPEDYKTVTKMQVHNLNQCFLYLRAAQVILITQCGPLPWLTYLALGTVSLILQKTCFFRLQSH